MCGFGDKNLNLIYFGECFKEDPNSGMPDKFSFEVIPRKYNENWSMGVDIFHNPNATTKLPFDYFPYCNHHYFNDEHQFCSIILNLAPYWSKIYIN